MEMTREEDVHQATDRLQSLDSDHWCQVWSEIASPYEERGQAEEKAGKFNLAKNNYMLAYNYYRMARFPVPNTRAKKAAYQASVDSYVKASRYFDPPLERVVIPFAGREGEGKEIRAYLRKPKGTNRPPVLINHAGVDVFKEEQCLMEPAFLDRGMATLSMDMAGTGESPILGSMDAERIYDPILSFLQNRSDIDGSRIGILGMSFGGYWVTKIAHIELDRLKAAVCWGGGVHYTFQTDWQYKCRYAPTHLGNEDLIVTRSHSFGVFSFEEWLEYVPKLSLLSQGILDRPCIPLLIVNGKNDAHVPLEDHYLLLEHGSPKAVRLFPGGHMGMTPQTLPTIGDWMKGLLRKRDE
jgi:pimeloyl-ACP methyl ester carboxylesterase